ncbi:hypothetical protein TXIAM_10108 [Tenacibaculum xiamenense]
MGFVSLASFAQKSLSSKLGNVTKEELEMVIYNNDIIAGALVLKEHENYYIDKKRRHCCRLECFHNGIILIVN